MTRRSRSVAAWKWWLVPPSALCILAAGFGLLPSARSHRGVLVVAAVVAACLWVSSIALLSHRFRLRPPRRRTTRLPARDALRVALSTLPIALLVSIGTIAADALVGSTSPLWPHLSAQLSCMIAGGALGVATQTLILRRRLRRRARLRP